MKKHLLAIAALAAVSGSVAAQNVTVYGALDGGIEHMSRDPETGKSLTRFGQNNLQATVWGFRGTEDLGGGMKAGFNLEAYVNTADGTRNAFSTGSSDLFSRAANISLEGSAGKVVLGRQLDPAFLVGFAGTDPRGARERNSGLITWATGGNGAGTNQNTNNHANIFDSNAVSYYGSFGGLNVGLGYAFGGIAGETSANTVTTVGANYSNSGFTVSGSYSMNKGTTANTNSGQYDRWSTGVAYKLGAATLKANYMETEAKDNNGVVQNDNRTYGVGAEYQLDPKNLLSVAYYDSKNKKIANDTSKTWIISNEYSLSKRTILYATYSNNKGGSGFTHAADMLYTSQGKTNNVTQAGIVHKF